MILHYRTALMKPVFYPKRRSKTLIRDSYRLSLFISTLILSGLLLIFLLLASLLIIRTINQESIKTADELKTLVALPLYNVDDEQLLRIAESLLLSRRISGIRIYSNASGEIINNLQENRLFWFPPQTRLIEDKGIELGELTIQFSEDRFYEYVSSFAIISLIVLISVLLANYLANRWLIQSKTRKTFTALITGLDNIAYGHDDYSMPMSGYGDIDQIIKSMNEMSGKIGAKKHELQEANEKLETRVRERTAELESSLSQLHQMQDRLIESERLSALGKLSAGVAHEFNTPLGAILSSAGLLIGFFDTKLESLIDSIRNFNRTETDLFTAVLSKGLAQNKGLILRESSRKQLQQTTAMLESQGVESSREIAENLIDNGLEKHIEDFMPLLKQPQAHMIIESALQPATARRMLEIIFESAQKASVVVSALKSYISPANHEQRQIVDIDSDISKVTVLLHNLLKHGITVHNSFGKVKVRGYADKLSQVWLNLLRNPAQAMDYRGTINISTSIEDNFALIKIRDSGKGIPESIKSRIFDPFFSTRSEGEGMGLGLDICKRIIEDHGGSIYFESSPGNTVFTVKLPQIVNEQNSG